MPAKKTTSTKKTTTEKSTESVYIQFAGAEYDLSVIKENIKRNWTEKTGKKESDIKELQIYVKPEETAAYYVINNEFVEEGMKVDL